MKINGKKVPTDVMYVITMQNFGFVGQDTLNRMNEIINKYPEWFPWETIYNNLPDEVHTAYLDEKYPNRHEPITYSLKDSGNDLIDAIGIGLYAQINKAKYEEPEQTDKCFAVMMKEFLDMCDNELKEEKKRTAEDKALWDKHYSKYKLEFRQ